MSPILVPTLDELEVEFERGLALCLSTGAAANAASEDHALDMASNDAVGALVGICGAIAELPAQNFAHVRLKARALLWFQFPGEQQRMDTADRLTRQMIDAILEGLPAEQLAIQGRAA